MLKLSDAAALADSRGVAAAPPELLHLAGRYRLDRVTQSVLEDLRQRLSRKGGSLTDFRQIYLPQFCTVLERIGLDPGQALRELHFHQAAAAIECVLAYTAYPIWQINSLQTRAAAERSLFYSFQSLL